MYTGENKAGRQSSGELPGYTSWTVSVKRNGTLDTYDENVMQIFSTRAA